MVFYGLFDSQEKYWYQNTTFPENSSNQYLLAITALFASMLKQYFFWPNYWYGFGTNFKREIMFWKWLSDNDFDLFSWSGFNTDIQCLMVQKVTRDGTSVAIYKFWDWIGFFSSGSMARTKLILFSRRDIV